MSNQPPALNTNQIAGTVPWRFTPYELFNPLHIVNCTIANFIFALILVYAICHLQYAIPILGVAFWYGQKIN
jgi:hypothetical protein